MVRKGIDDPPIVDLATLLVVFLLAASCTWAQSATGSISGVVRDESGAVIPGANVTVTNVDTGISRSVVTDSAGRYRVTSLIPSMYQVQAQVAGFETTVRRGIQLTVASDLEINMVLRVGQVAQQTVVTAEAPLVQTLTGAVSGLVDDRAIRDLPLNGRSMDQLIALQSSAPQIRMRGTTVAVGGASYVVGGARDQSNQFLMDGTEMIGAGSRSLTPGGALAINMGVEAIREFVVLGSSYSAAYGKKGGGVINMATRSGTNAFHGSVFAFHRNDNLDARNFFDPGDPPEFLRNQFGGALGGPIRRDQTFFFGNYEGLREGLGLTDIDQVPDDNARQGLLPDPRNPGQFINVGVAPEMKPYLVLFPRANGRNFGDGSAEAILNPLQVSNQNFYLARFDHRLSDKDSFFARYNFTNANQFQKSDVLLFRQVIPSSAHVLTLEETRAYATTVNTIRFGFARATIGQDAKPTQPFDSSLRFIPEAREVGQLNFELGVTRGAPGALTSQGPSQTDRHWAFNQFEIQDQVFHQHGPHSLQFGVQVQRLQENLDFGGTKWGAFNFIDLQDFLTGRPDLFVAPDPFGGGDANKGNRVTFVAAYVQDDYKVRPNLTLNLGVRWEYLTSPTEVNNRRSNYHVNTVDGLFVVASSPALGAPLYESHKTNFAPRVGFAWDVQGDAKTAVRGGFGIYYDQNLVEFSTFTSNNPPFFGLVQIPNPSFPVGFSTGTTRRPIPGVDAIDVNLDVPTRLQYNLSVQRQLTSNTAFTLGYVGSNAYHLTRRRPLNTRRPQFLPDGDLFYPGGALINPEIGRSLYISSDATSTYHSVQAEVVQRFTRGLRYKVSFTYAKYIDSASIMGESQRTGDNGSTMHPYNLGRDRGLSSFDVRRNLVANFTYDFPWQNATAAAVRWIGGWQVGGIVTLSDGMPFTAYTGFNQSRDRARTTVDRPNLRPGASKNPVRGGPDRYFDPGAFELQPAGRYGNLGRNTLIAPSLATFDFTLVKVIPVSERVKMDFRAEFFNLFNRANFGLPRATIFSSSGEINGAAGRISATVTASRQIQLGLKLLF